MIYDDIILTILTWAISILTILLLLCLIAMRILEKKEGGRWMWTPEIIACFFLGHKWEFAETMRFCPRCNLLKKI